jgi:hypothetical protein
MTTFQWCTFTIDTQVVCALLHSMVDIHYFFNYSISMNSLKSIIPLLADIVALSEHALYERQRALVRGGLIKGRQGRGPGSGVEATPETVAMLLISVLATDSLSSVIQETATFATGRRDDRVANDSDAMPTLRTFKAAVVHSLSSDEDEISSITVSRESRVARVQLRDGRSIVFGKPRFHAFVRVTAQLMGDALPHVRRLLRLTSPPPPDAHNRYFPGLRGNLR